MKKFLLLFMVFCGIANAQTLPPPQEILEKSCAIFSENWQGLRYHYPNGKVSFLKECLGRIQGKNLVEGLWEIRSMMPDGHANFQIVDNKSPAKIHPLVFAYDMTAKELRVGAALDDSFNEYVGKKIETINGKPFMDLLMERATLEPQSTLTSSMEIAARTLTETLSEKPYPDFSKKMDLVFDDGSMLTMEARNLEPLEEANRYVLSANSYSSFWGDAGVSEENDYCIHKRAITRLINFNGKKWLWWHPRSLSFKLDEVEEMYSCWEAEIGKADGVVLDLRDTAGGGFKQIYLLAHQFSQTLPTQIRSLVSDGQLSREMMEDAKSILIATTEAGDLRELEMKTSEIAKKVTPWKGRLVLMMNGLCGSACDMIAYHLQQRENTCTYGTPTAGRLIAYDTVHPVSPERGVHVDLSLPYDEILKPDESRWEGVSVVPTHIENGDVREALKVCEGELRLP